MQAKQPSQQSQQQQQHLQTRQQAQQPQPAVQQQSPRQQQAQQQQASSASANQNQPTEVTNQAINAHQAVQNLAAQSAHGSGLGNPTAIHSLPTAVQPSQLIGSNNALASNLMAGWANINRFNPEQSHTMAPTALNAMLQPQNQAYNPSGMGNIANNQDSTQQVHRSPAEAFLPVDAAQLEVNHAPSFTAQQYATQSPFDWSIFTNASTNLATANQADLAFWREMPIGFADTSDWDVFTDSYAHQLLTHIPSLNSFGTDDNGVNSNSGNSGQGQ